MMRSPNFWSVAVRAPSGDIVVKTEPVTKAWIFRQKWLQMPFIRGTLALLDTMVLGHQAMRFAGEVTADERFLPLDQRTASQADREKQKSKEQALIGITVIVSLIIGVLIFDFGPEGLAQLSMRMFGLSLTGTNAVAEVVKLVLFLGYLLLIRRIPAILDVFRYHGAEHAAINAMEHRQELTPANCMAHSRFHLRCGTNFAIMVVLIGFLVFIPLPRDLFVPQGSPEWVMLLTRMGVRLMVLPVVAGISYELIRIAGRAKDKRLLTAILTPGLWTQLITTEPPAEKHAEVAIEALRAVNVAEDDGGLTNTDLDAVAAAYEDRLRAEASPA